MKTTFSRTFFPAAIILLTALLLVGLFIQVLLKDYLEKQAMDRLLKLKSSQVHVHLVDVIPAEELKGITTVEIGERVYEMMIGDLGEELRTDEKGMHPDLQRQRMGQ